MSMILKSYDEGKIPLEEWTDDMLATLPGWSGWQYSTDIWYAWKDAITNTYPPIGYPALTIPAGGCCLLWTLSIYPVYTASQRKSMNLIAGRPFVQYGEYFYIRGDLQYTWAQDNTYSIARCTSIPGA